MHIVDLSIKRPVLTLTVIIAFVVFGLLAFTSMPMSLFPDIKAPYVTIQTIYGGASPQVIESQVTKKIEDQISSIADLDTITSTTVEGASVVVAEFKYGKDENVAVQEVKDKIEAIASELPDDADKPSISKVDISAAMPVMNVVLEGTMDATELYTYAQTIASSELAQVSGVGSVEISGGQARQIDVTVSKETVFERSLPITQIAGILAAGNAEIPGGNMRLDGRKYPVRLKGEYDSLDEIRNLDVDTASGTFKVRQLADVEDSTAEVVERTILLNKTAGTRNENALLLKVIKNPTANTIDVVRDVNKAIKTLETQGKGTVHYEVVKEDATFVKDTVNDTLSNVYLGILFTGLVLLLFLHDLRSTLIVAIAMPFSIVATFLVMSAMGISLNMLSLMGLSSATGTLVANSVVVLENIFRYKELGHDRVESASRGTKEVMVAVFASTLTNVAVFVPLANMSGVMGATLSNFAYTIVISTIFSIFVSFTLTPLMASRILPDKTKKDGKVGAALEAAFHALEEGYRSTLAATLKTKKRAALVVVSTVAIFALAVSLFAAVKFELIPTTDGGKVNIAVELPQGAELPATAKKLEEIEGIVAAYPEVESVLTTLGSDGSSGSDVNLASVDLFLSAKSRRKASNSDVAVRAVRDLASVSGAEIRVKAVSEISMDTGSPISLSVRGIDSDELMGVAQRVKDGIEEIPGTMNVKISAKAGKAEIVFTPDRKAISADGLTVQGVAVAIRAAVDGITATTYKDKGEEYDIRVKIAESSLLTLEDLKNLPIVTQSGTRPLSRYATLSFADGYNKITRTDKSRTLDVSADLLPGYSQGSVLGKANAAVAAIDLPEGYSVKASGTSESLGDTVSDLVRVFFIAVALTYMLLAAILESFVQPLFILATIPLSIIGVVAGCLLTGATLNFVAMLGIVMLVGIVVNNAILILDYYNQLKRGGTPIKEALVTACPTKLKAILMSNIAIILGMVPMALGLGASGAEMRKPMGIIIIGGIVSSTVMTLWLIPALERLLSRKKPAKKQKEGQQ